MQDYCNLPVELKRRATPRRGRFTLWIRHPHGARGNPYGAATVAVRACSTPARRPGNLSRTAAGAKSVVDARTAPGGTS